MTPPKITQLEKEALLAAGLERCLMYATAGLFPPEKLDEAGRHLSGMLDLLGLDGEKQTSVPPRSKNRSQKGT